MDTVLNFESKKQNLGGEKVYSAREIMNIAGYDKWERFYGAILRAVENESKKSIIEKNFFFRTITNTGGRPKEDVFLTLGGCYLVFKQCDNRKQEIQVLLSYLDNLLKEKRTKKIVLKANFDKIYLLGIIFLIIFFIVCLIINLYFLFDKNGINNNKNIINNINQENILKSENISVTSTNTGDILTKENNIIKEEKQDFQEVLNNYILSPQKTYFINKNLNYRNDFTKTLTGINLINSFFVLGNNGLYNDSCSLLSKSNCNNTNKYGLKSFSNYWEKVKNGYEILGIYSSLRDNSVYCVKYRYKLKYDTSGKYITEIFNYKLENNSGVWEITKRFCEKIEKNGRILKCPFKLNNYYCVE